jgi:hypothetical protein
MTGLGTCEHISAALLVRLLQKSSVFLIISPVLSTWSRNTVMETDARQDWMPTVSPFGNNLQPLAQTLYVCMCALVFVYTRPRHTMKLSIHLIKLTAVQCSLKATSALP